MGAGLNIDVGCCTVEYVYDDAAGYVYDVVASGLLVTIVVTKGVCCIDVVSIGFSFLKNFMLDFFQWRERLITMFYSGRPCFFLLECLFVIAIVGIRDNVENMFFVF